LCRDTKSQPAEKLILGGLLFALNLGLRCKAMRNDQQTTRRQNVNAPQEAAIALQTRTDTDSAPAPKVADLEQSAANHYRAVHSSSDISM